MYKRILVPLDGTQQSEQILDRVENLAKGYGSKLFLLQVVEEPLMLGHDEVVEASTLLQQKQRRSHTESYLKRIEKRFQKKGIEAQHCIAFGPVVGNLLNIAEQEDVGLIALASHGLDGSYQTMRRSVAASLLQRSNYPVMVIRSKNNNVL